MTNNTVQLESGSYPNSVRAIVFGEDEETGAKLVEDILEVHDCQEFKNANFLAKLLIEIISDDDVTIDQFSFGYDMTGIPFEYGRATSIKTKLQRIVRQVALHNC